MNAVRRRSDGWALAAIMLAGGLNFGWQLGSSSYFVDEALSILHSLPPLSAVTGVVRMTETTPWTYFFFLHEWIYRTGSQAEWVTRLPSAIAGFALVAAVYWMGGAFLDRRPALLAAGLCALSPLILQYAQQARVYVFAMLAVTIAVGATVRASSASRGRTRMLVLGAVAAVTALWLHYTTALVILPLCLWLGACASLSRRQRGGFIGVCLLAQLLLLPLFVDQFGYAPNGGIGTVARITWTNVVRIAETPFDGRWLGGSEVIRLLGAAVVIFSLLALSIPRVGAVRNRRLLAALGTLGPLTIIALGVAGKDVLITRYTAVAAPFLLTALAAALAILPRGAAVSLTVVALVVAGTGLVASHRQTGFYAPTRQTIDYIQAYQRPGDELVTPGYPRADDIPLVYYGQRRMHPLLEYIVGSPAGVSAAFDSHHRVWLIRQGLNNNLSPRARLRLEGAFFRAVGFRALSVHTFRTSTTFAVFLAVATDRPASTPSRRRPEGLTSRAG